MTTAEHADIWIIDDDSDFLVSIQAILRHQEWQARGFSSPSEALDTAQHECPDLVIIDLMMPEISGFDTIRQLRHIPHFHTLPIIVLTALVSEQALLHAFDAGADDFLYKPFNLDELLARIRCRLQAHHVLTDLDQRNRDAGFLLDMSEALNRSLDFRTVLRQLVQRAAQALQVARCSILLCGPFQHFGSRQAPEELPAARTCRLVAASDKLDIDDFYLSIDDYPEIQQVIRTRQPVIVEDVERSPLLDPVKHELRELGVRSLVLFPMTVYDELVGVLFIRSTLARWHLNPRRQTLALTTANVAANAIRNAWTYEEIVQERQRLDNALQALRETQDFLARLIDASVDAIVASDTSGDIIVFNKAAEQILGYRAADVIGALKVWALYPGDGARRIMRMLRSEEHGGVGRLDAFRTLLIDVAGVEIPVSISAAIVSDDQGEPRATMGIFTDLRERLRIEQELERANEDLEITRRKVVVAELAGAAAHELNQPLTSALNYTELLNLKLPPDDPNRAYVEVIMEQIGRMAEIVRKIGHLRDYRTKVYVGDTRIVDLDPSPTAVTSPPSLVATPEKDPA